MIRNASRRVLVVDDEPSVREMLSDFLELNNFICMQAENGESAIAVTRREQFDLIIMDVRMPGVSGIETLREIKRELPEQPVVMVTAVAEVETAVEAMRLGANDYVLKPFVLHDMLSKVDQAIVAGLTRPGSPIGMDEDSVDVTVAVGVPMKDPAREADDVEDDRDLTELADAFDSLAEQVLAIGNRMRALARKPIGHRRTNGTRSLT